MELELEIPEKSLGEIVKKRLKIAVRLERGWLWKLKTIRKFLHKHFVIYSAMLPRFFRIFFTAFFFVCLFEFFPKVLTTIFPKFEKFFPLLLPIFFYDFFQRLPTVVPRIPFRFFIVPLHILQEIFMDFPASLKWVSFRKVSEIWIIFSDSLCGFHPGLLPWFTRDLSWVSGEVIPGISTIVHFRISFGVFHSIFKEVYSRNFRKLSFWVFPENSKGVSSGIFIKNSRDFF